MKHQENQSKKVYLKQVWDKNIQQLNQNIALHIDHYSENRKINQHKVTTQTNYHQLD